MAIEALELAPRPVDETTDGTLYFIGNATVLVRLGGFTFLTDPNFLHQGDYAKLGGGLRSRRLTEPAIEIAQLPPLDFIILSHHHGDHIDDVAVRELDKSVPVITTEHAARKLRRQGFGDTRALATWDTQAIVRGEATVRVTALPAIHAPQPLRTLLPPVMGSMVELKAPGRPPFRLYISGDTLIHDDLRQIPRRYPEIDVGLLHLGGTRVMGIWLTMNARQGLEALQIVAPRTVVPIHYNDYTVFKSPLDDFKRLVEEAGLGGSVEYLAHGDSLRLPLPGSE